MVEIVEQQISLTELAKSLAGPGRRYNYFHAKVFSLVAPSLEELVHFFKNVTFDSSSTPGNQPASILVADFSPLIKHQATHVLSVANGQLRALYEISDRKLPSCPYFAIIAPALKTEISTSYADADQAINFVRTLLALHFGKLLFYESVTDFDFDLEGKVAFSSAAFRVPMFADFARILDWQLALDILNRLKNQQKDFREQFQSACNFISGALNQRDEPFRFSSYWIALEVLSRGTSGAIRAKLARAYNASKSFVDSDLRFGEIAEIRHNLLHKGQFKTLKSYQERLMQLYFWDIAIDQMNLRHRALAQDLAKSGIIEQEIDATTPKPTA